MVFAALVALAAPRSADAEDIRAHATAGIAHALVEPQSQEFGFGVTGSASLEIPAGRIVGFELKASGLVLAKGDPPKDKTLAPQSTGTAFLGTGGIRIRPFTPIAGPWASIGAGFVETGNRPRFGLDAQIGWDFRVGRGRLDVGPYIGFVDVVQPNDSLRPDDAYVFSLGFHVGLGVKRIEPPPPPPVIDTPPPPPPPRPDRDNDTVFDDEDACPDLPGVRTADPKTNGCPLPPPVRDRDGDGVPDAEDACPDVPGIHTEDPKTNGCPAATDQIRVEADRILFDEVILFDLDSPRVRHASWPIIGKLADFIVKNPDILEVSIEGHADATGTEAHNLALSRQRAESVKTLLVQGGVDASRVKAEAFGRSHLKVQTEHAEQANRRVEFWITRTNSGKKTP